MHFLVLQKSFLTVLSENYFSLKNEVDIKVFGLAALGYILCVSHSGNLIIFCLFHSEWHISGTFELHFFCTFI